jgi:hypothetical protein
MYQEEIRALLSDIHGLDPSRLKHWLEIAPNVIGFQVVGEHVKAFIKGERFHDGDPEVVDAGFLALGCTQESSRAGQKCSPDHVCDIGLSLAHPFPRTVKGTLTGIVKRTTTGDLCLLSVNHVLWMNGWAKPTTKIVSKPFANPPLTTVGIVPYPDLNIPLRGCCQINTYEELALAPSACPVDPSWPLPHPPAKCDPSKPIYRLDCSEDDKNDKTNKPKKIRKRQADVVTTGFRLAQRFEYGRFLFRRQILIHGNCLTPGKDGCGGPTLTPFASRGDSGSLLFQEIHNVFAPVAVLWAGSPDNQAEFDYYVAVPLLPYFEKMQLEFVYYRPLPAGISEPS